MILLSLDPSSRWEWTPEGQDAAPPGRRVVCNCRFPTSAEYLRMRAFRIEAQNAADDEAYIEGILKSLSVVVETVTIGGQPVDGVRALLDIASPVALWEWAHGLAHACQLREIELGKSEQPSHGRAARSARVAVAAANGVADA